MIRLFNVYYPTRTLVLLLCEVLLVGGSFLLAAACLVYWAGWVRRLFNALIYENGLLKIAGITVLTLLLTYYFDLYGPRRISAGWEIYFRLLLVLSVLSFVLAGLVYSFPGFGHRSICACRRRLHSYRFSRPLALGLRVDHWSSHLPRARLCPGLRRAGARRG